MRDRGLFDADSARRRAAARRAAARRKQFLGDCLAVLSLAILLIASLYLPEVLS